MAMVAMAGRRDFALGQLIERGGVGHHSPGSGLAAGSSLGGVHVIQGNVNGSWCSAATDSGGFFGVSIGIPFWKVK